MKPVVRPLNPESRAEIELVASRMRLTLIDVLGEEVGGNMYTMDWLLDRARFHLDPTRCTGQILLAENCDGKVTGHTILRVQDDEEFGQHGLFSTFYVIPECRGQGIATEFVTHGEAWMREQGMSTAMTYTAEDNTRLRNLMEKLGYEVVLKKNDMVALAKRLHGDK